MGGLFLLGGVFGGLMLLIPVVLVLALLVILALRHDEDVDERRAPAIYGSIIAFVALVTLLIAATGVASSLSEITADDTGGIDMDMGMRDIDMSEFEDDMGRFRYGSDDNDDEAVSAAIAFFLAGVAALGVLLVHRSLFAERHGATGAARRVHRAYLLVMCFTMALIAMAAAAGTLYQLYRAIAPDTADAPDRGAAMRDLVPMLVLFVGAGGLWKWHWDELGLAPSAPPPVVTTDAP